MSAYLRISIVAASVIVVLAACSTATPGQQDSESLSSPTEESLAGSADPGSSGSTSDGGDEVSQPTKNTKAQQKKERAFTTIVDAEGESYRPAVVELGYEACRRIKLTAANDQDALISALADDEIPYATEAIKTLCPEFQGYLDQVDSGN